jgi:hypothetical protein
LPFEVLLLLLYVEAQSEPEERTAVAVLLCGLLEKELPLFSEFIATAEEGAL